MIFVMFIVLGIVASPFLIYFLVKFGRYGYLRANDLHAEEQQEKQEYKSKNEY